MAAKPDEELVRERINVCTKAARYRFRDAVRPIYGVTDRGDPNHIGSALLLELPEGHFMLTAAHVIDWSAETSLYLGADEFVLLQFEAFITVPPNGKREEDHVDFAVARLDADMVSKISGVKFISEADISCTETTTDGQIYTCLGYPNSKNKVTLYTGKKVTPKLFTYTSIGRPASFLPNIAIADLHILVDYNAQLARDDSGKKVNATPIKGCSGGAIVDVGRITTDSRPPEPKLAALLIEGHPQQKVILGTRVTVILDYIRTHFQAHASHHSETVAPSASVMKDDLKK
ncbi:MAG: hypothetical protein NXI18_18495 [Alphaproteobacteria bacterium]|nr:hypothetical protein [Alphaproteobacteria bacterium]